MFESSKHIFNVLHNFNSESDLQNIFKLSFLTLLDILFLEHIQTIFSMNIKFNSGKIYSVTFWKINFEIRFRHSLEIYL